MGSLNYLMRLRMVPTLSVGVIVLYSEIFTQIVSAQCNSGAFVNKHHTWNKGYVGKLHLDQTWLSGPTITWQLNVTMASEVAEFKVWDADIVNPATTSNNVSDVTNVGIVNKCYNSIIYPCQYLEITFLVRFPEGISNETTSDYDISMVREDVSYSDTSDGYVVYCSPTLGQPTANITTG